MTYQPELPIPDPQAQREAERRRRHIAGAGRRAAYLRWLARRNAANLRKATRPDPDTPDQEEPK